MDLKTLYSLLAAEHARLHVVAAWPSSIYKDVRLRAIHSSIESLTAGQSRISFKCMECLGLRRVPAPSFTRPTLHRRFSKAA